MLRCPERSFTNRENFLQVLRTKKHHRLPTVQYPRNCKSLITEVHGGCDAIALGHETDARHWATDNHRVMQPCPSFSQLALPALDIFASEHSSHSHGAVTVQCGIHFQAISRSLDTTVVQRSIHTFSSLDDLAYCKPDVYLDPLPPTSKPPFLFIQLVKWSCCTARLPHGTPHDSATSLGGQNTR